MDNIGCYLITKNKLEPAQIPEELLIGLTKNLRNNGVETVHFIDRSMEVEGIYIPAKGTDNSIIIIPND